MGFISIIEANRGLSDKGEWVNVSPPEVHKNTDVQRDVYDIIQSSYAPLGGHPDYRSVGDVPGDCDQTYAVDTDAPDDVDAAILAKTTAHGSKLVAMGSDGGRSAKVSVLKKAIDLLNSRGNYCEASGKVQQVLMSYGVDVITDPEVIKTLLKGKEVTMNPDGSYNRKIGGVERTKMMFGNPIVGGGISESLYGGDDFYDDYGRVEEEVKEEWMSGKRHQSWKLVPRAKLLRLYREYGKYGRINEGILLDVWSILHDAVLKIIINSESKHHEEWPYGMDYTEFMGPKEVKPKKNPNQPEFDLDDPREVIYKEYTDKEIKRLNDRFWRRWFLFVSDLSNSKFFRNFGEVKGNARYSDQSNSLAKLLHRAYSVEDDKGRLLAIDTILNFVHGLGKMAKWLVEGGAATLDQIAEFNPSGITNTFY